jgi:hypothetical protein
MFKITPMKTLHALLHSFNLQQVGYIRSVIKRGRETGESKYILLFDFMLESQSTPSLKATAAKLYKTPPDSRITKLASRLEEKVLEIVISEKFLEQYSSIVEFDIRSVRLRKTVAQYTALQLAVGADWYVRHLLDKAIQNASKCGNSAALLDLYANRRTYAMDKKSLAYYNQQMDYFKKCWEVDNMVLKFYLMVVQFGTFQGTATPEKIRITLKRMIDEIEKNKEFLFSARTKMRYALIRIDYYHRIHQYENAKQIIVEARKIADLDMFGHQEYNARFMTELGGCEGYLGNYKKAIQCYEKGLKILKGISRQNYYISLTRLFSPVFYLDRLSYAQRIVEELCAIAHLRQDDIRFSKYVYYRACIDFRRRKFNDVVKNLSTTYSLNKDKIGHDFAIRILRIQSLIMLQKLDEASAGIHALRKHVSRYAKKFYLSARDKAMLKILLLAERRGFSGPAKKAESDLVEKLKAKKGEYMWEPFTNELIRFQEWYAGSPLADSN